MYKLVSIFDIKAQCYELPHYVRSIGEAIRSFQTLVNGGSKPSLISQYPADFQLFDLGSFDELTGVFSLHAAPKFLGSGDSFVVKASEMV